MSKWDEIDKKFDEVLEQLSDDDWREWDKKKDLKAAERKKALAQSGFIQSITFQVTNNYIETMYAHDEIFPFHERVVLWTHQVVQQKTLTCDPSKLGRVLFFS